MSAELGRFPREQISELHRWRCHVPQVGCGLVIARSMAGARIEEYLVRVDALGRDFWVEAAAVRAIATNILSFPRVPVAWRAS